MYYLLIILPFILFSTHLQGETQKTIAIFTYKVLGMKQWDPDSIKTGIAGSEETVIYASDKLAKLGYQVIVFGDPPKSSPHSLPNANPRYVPFDYRDEKKIDIAIAWRMPCSAKQLKLRAEKVYLWPHDTYHQKIPESDILAFDDVLWLSEWQRQFWISINPPFTKFTKIFGNGINPDQFQKITSRKNPYSCIYGSNYARGLKILLDIWPSIKKKFPRATLDIYYGWQHWGLLSPEMEAQMKSQIANYASLDVKEHGQVGHEELNRAYAEASLWTYPCTGWEVFCITAIRAQLAGAVPVIIEDTALSETVRHGFKCHQPEDYEKTLIQAMEQIENISLMERKKMGEFILQEYTWDVITTKWKDLFENVKAQTTSSVVDK